MMEKNLTHIHARSSLKPFLVKALSPAGHNPMRTLHLSVLIIHYAYNVYVVYATLCSIFKYTADILRHHISPNPTINS